MMMLVVSWNIFANKSVIWGRFNYLGESTVPIFFHFLTKHDLIILIENINKKIRYVKDWQPLLSLLFVSATLKRIFLKNAKELKSVQLINSLKFVLNIYPNNNQNLALPKIPLKLMNHDVGNVG